jgi:hypothetical protein
VKFQAVPEFQGLGEPEVYPPGETDEMEIDGIQGHNGILIVLEKE